MTLPLVVLRPEPGQTATLVAAFERGMKAVGMPLCQIEPVAWRAPALEFDGLLLGSANAVRHGGAELDKVAHLPALCVGATTAEVAKEAGLAVERVGEGGLQSLLDGLDGEERRLLRIAGEDRVALSPPASVSVETVVAYRAVYVPMSEAQSQLLRNGAVVLLHSGTLASHLASECARLDIDRSAIRIAVLAPRIAERAGEGWGRIAIAETPRDSALLAAAHGLCDKGG